MRYEVYFETLQSLTVDELKDAVDRYLHSAAVFRPSPGQILAMVDREPAEKYRHRREPDDTRTVEQMTPERMAEIKRSAGFDQEVAAAPLPAMPPWTPAELEHHRELAPKLKEALERRLKLKECGAA